MKTAISSLVFAAAASVVHATSSTKCNADNCARAVTGTAVKLALESRRADCSSFFRTTVTPDVFTEVVWETVTPFTVTPVTNTETVFVATVTEYNTVATTTSFITQQPPVKRGLDRRAVTEVPSVVPAYASPCSGTVRYSSACSCWGVAHETIEAPTPTVIVTSTESATATVTGTVTEYKTSTVVLPTTAVVVSSCPTPFYSVCSGQCKHTRSDPNNCGACGNVCASGSCVNGVCASPQTSCPNTHNCQAGGDLYPACSSRPAYPASSFCLCFKTYDNLRFCTDSNSRACAVIPLCNTHDDCGLGNVCIINGCCHGGAKYCRPIGSPTCFEPSAPSRLFRYRSKRSDEPAPVSALEGETELGYIS
ncbi:hypothetical protein TWF730_001534 [Orbilia blumenaviensis]|uniref:Uncharacterized protein n=1 Tax=Orbilia blumenaviensis TaxID=1796055 RepID=A0AAV9ULB3_9PEZI